jgi:hypothetical protein
LLLLVVYIGMASIESVIAALKSLSPGQLEQAASYIHQLRQQAQVERTTAIRSTSGILSPQEADEWMNAIESCEQVDESTW